MTRYCQRVTTPDLLSRGGYWRESHDPLTNLVFVAPLLLVYEGGLLLVGAAAMRNGADVWLRSLLEVLGFTQYFLLPGLTCALLLAWQHLTRGPWQVRGRTLSGMLLESLLLGLCLLLLASAQRWCWMRLPLAASSLPVDALGRCLGSFGAGLYEELMFRLLLLPAIAALLRSGRVPRTSSLLVAAVATSLLFAAAHYQLAFAPAPIQWATAHGEPFAWATFCFRTLAGLFFAAVFLLRGFGIAVGAHALYDVLILAGSPSS